MYKNKVSLLVLASVFFFQLAIGQNNTNSPYTRFGYGDLNDTNSGEQRGMGGVSIGSHSKFNINTVNPASYSSVDSMTFMFDIGSSALISRFSDGINTKSTTNANLEYITMQFPLWKGVGFSAGLLPYTFSGYNFSTKDSIAPETNTPNPQKIMYTESFWGDGGISQVYSGISANLFNHISLGINAYYMFGTVNNNRSVTFTNTSENTAGTEIKTIRANNLRFRFGAQFYNTFAKKHDLTLGLIYEQKAKMNGSSSTTSYGTQNGTENTGANFELPTMFGIGLNYTYNKQLSFGLDYSMQQWKDAQYYGKTDTLSNRSKLAFGVEYIPNPMGRKFANKIRYRAGFNMSDSYIKVNNTTPAKNYGVSLGLGLPVYNKATNTASMINTSIEYGKIGGVSQLKEDYLKITLNITFNEHWFFKRKL